MHCTAALWAPVAPGSAVTALGVDAGSGGACCYAGCRDGSISSWRQQQASMAPVALLQGHTHPIVAVLPGLTGPGAPGASSAGSRHLLSLDAEGWLALWDCSTWRCLDMTRAAPLPAGARPTLLLMPDQEHVCVIIPATPSLQQEQQTLWQHQHQHQQARSPCSPQAGAQRASSHPGTAAHLSPMMLVLRWASLALAAAPLVSNLGLVALTSSSVTLDAADAVVAAAVLDTAPALSPTAADSVVLAVSRSGWMWAGSLAGSSLGQAWQKPLAAGASTAPLSGGCLRVQDASAHHSSAGGSHTSDVQLQLLLVQGDAWRLLVGSHFSSSTGMPQQWTQVAHQQLLAQPGRSLAAHGNGSAAAPRVRFALRDSSTVSAENECLVESDTMSDDGSSSSSSSNLSSESDSVGNSGASAGSGTTGGAVDGAQRSKLARCTTRASTRTVQQHEQLLGGVLLQVPGRDTTQQAVVVWTDHGQQQLWVVQEQQQLQEQQPACTLQLQPWPAPRPRHHHHHAAAAAASPAAAGVFAAADAAGSCYVLLSHHHGFQHLGSAWPWLAGAEQLLPHRHPGDWHMHASRVVLPHALDAPSSNGLPPQQQQWQLHAVQGSWKAAWSRQGLYRTTSSSSAISSSTLDLCRELHEVSAINGSAESTPMAVDDQPGVTAMDATPSCNAAGRKRPAAEGAADSPDSEAAAGGGSSSCSQGPAPGVAKQPRVAAAHAGDSGCEHAAAVQAAAAIQDGQQQRVTRMQLLGSDAPGVQQLAVMLESGAILFYDLALYTVPGAAWHPDCCCVGSGHTGRVTCTVEVVFRCPPQCLVTAAPVAAEAAAGAAADVAAGHTGNLPWPVDWDVGEHGSKAGDGSGIPTAAAQRHHHPQQQHQQQQQQQHGHSVCTAADAHCPPPGTSCRPAQGGSVPLLLTGGRDGSVRAWDLRLQHLGEPWMSVHPHTAAVDAIVLPPVACRLPWSCCVLSVCAAGRVALSCLATGTLKRSFDGWGLGPPAQLAWSTGRGLLAAGGWDAAGLWQVAVWDTYTGQLDRQLSGGAAHMLMATLAQELTSSMRHLRRAQGQAGGAGMLAAQQLQASSSADLQWQASDDGRSGGCEGGQFVPRLQLASHSSGPLAVLPGGRPDVLLLDVDVQQLVAGMEAFTRQRQQQHRGGSSRQRQAVRQSSGPPLSSRTSSLDADSIGTPMSARSSRANSLDLTGPFACLDSTMPAGASSTTSPQQHQQAMSPASAASDSTTAGAAASPHGGRPLQQCAGARLHSRTPQPPAVAAAVQGLCLLHRWGLEPQLDKQLLLLLLEQQGWGRGSISIGNGGQEVPAATAGAGQGGSTHALMRLLRPLLLDPAPGSPILCHAAPCLSQEVLLSGHGAAVLNLPAAPLATAREGQNVSEVAAAAPSLGVLLPAAPSMLASRLLTLVALSKWLMTSVPTQASVFACSGLVTQYALTLPELLAQAAAASRQTAAAAPGLSPRSSPAGVQLHARSQQPTTAVQTDLLLLSSAMLACPGLLAEAAQLLLTALLHPAVPGSYAVPEQQQQVVFTLPGAAAAASCWPPAVSQLAVLHQIQLQQAGQLTQQQPALSLSLQHLPLWLPQLVLSSAAAVGHPAEVPPELLAAVAAALIDVVLGTAPASSSCIAAGWLCQLLRSGAWAVWRPYIGKPAHLVHRLCSLVDRLQAASTDSRSAASAVISQVTRSHGATHHAAASSSSSEYRLLAQHPYAICDPRPSSSSIAAGGGQQHRQQQQHIEGGLFISAALLGSSGELASSGRQGTPSRAASPATGLSGGTNSAGSQQLVTTPSGIVYSTGAASRPGSANAGSSSSAAGLAASPPAVAGASGAVSPRMSRRSLVVWLRAALDLLAAVTLVDPAAVLMELSHKLAAPSADASSSSLALMVCALGRVLRRPGERPLLLPHLGFTAALAVQALDPARPALRHAMLQPVMSVVRELAGHFHQVDCHGTSLQLAVGSARPLVGHYSGSSSGGAAPSVVLAPTVAVFDMNGGTSKKVLLLPVLPHAAVAAPGAGSQQQQGERLPAAGPAAAHHRQLVGPFGSTSSLASATSSASSTAAAGRAPAAAALTSHLPSGMPSLWAAAEGSAAEAAGGGHSGLVGGSSSSSLASTVAAGDDAGSRRDSRTQPAEQLQRGQLASNTMTRAEAAMAEHWFGRRVDDAAGVGGAGSDAAGGRAQHDSGNPLQWGVWYPDAAAASRAVLTADDVSGGVAAVAFSPAGDAVAAFVLGSHCLVVWRLQASWTQKLANLGTSKPLSQLPHAYIRIPSAASLANAMLGKQGDSRTPSSPAGGSSSEVMQWQLKWQASGHIDLLFKGSQCGSIEVRL